MSFIHQTSELVTALEERGTVINRRSLYIRQVHEFADGTPVKENFIVLGLTGSRLKDMGQRLNNAVMIGFQRNGFVGKHSMVAAPPANESLEPTCDMAILAGMLMLQGWEPDDEIAFCGEVSSTGDFVRLRSSLAAGLLAAQEEFTLFVPVQSAPQAALSGGKVVGVKNTAALQQIANGEPIQYERPAAIPSDNGNVGMDMRHVRGQQRVRRALEIAIGGGHSLLMVGPPGCGKTLLAQCVPTIAPPLTREEILEVSAIHQSAGETEDIVTTRPVRFVGPKVSVNGLIGGGHNGEFYPGEVSLAHNGVLFLDEVLQFGRKLESLRGPMQDGIVNISRVETKAIFPASFQLIAACNPCPCGYWGSTRECTCTKSKRMAYAARLSGPIIERIPVRVTLDELSPQDVINGSEGEASEYVRERIIRARDAQSRRYAGVDFRSNDDIDASTIAMLSLSDSGSDMLTQVAETEQLSARGIHNLIKVARTVADLEGSTDIDGGYVAEASRFLDAALPTS